MAGYRHAALLFLLACLWSSSFTAIKVGVETITPVTMVAGRLTVAAITIYVLIRLSGRRLPRFDRVWVSYFLIGATGNGIPFALISWGEEVIDSGLAAILMAVMPLCTLVLAHFFTATDRMTAARAVGLAIGFGGIVILVGPGALAHLGEHTVRQLTVAGGAVFYAITTVLSRRLPVGADPLERSAAVLVCASLQMIPAAFVLETPLSLAPGEASLLSTVYLGVVPTALASIIYFHIIEAKGTTFFAVINYIIPCLGVLWGVLLLGETVELRSLVALGVILSGIFLANWRRASGAS